MSGRNFVFGSAIVRHIKVFRARGSEITHAQRNAKRSETEKPTPQKTRSSVAHLPCGGVRFAITN